MRFHHIGIATNDIEKAYAFVENNFEVLEKSEIIYDKHQDVTLQMIQTRDVNIELVTGNRVKNLIDKKTTYYHICYEVDDIHKAIDGFNGAILVSSPKEAILFDNRLVAFLMTPLGLVELLNAN
jgi:methylmalonyl-CoA/ethylmalonyl-CoA epimerase